MKTIEEKEVRGINVKQAFTYGFSVIALAVSLTMGYNAILGGINKNTSKNELQETRISTNELTIKTLQAINQKQEIRIGILESEIKYLKEKK